MVWTSKQHILLYHHPPALHPHELAPAEGLQHGEDLRETFIPHVLQLAKKSSLKENLKAYRFIGQRSLG